MIQNINCNDHVTNDVLYGTLSKISNTIRQRRLQLAGHMFRDRSSPAHLTVTWEALHGTTNRRRTQTKFVDTLLRDTSLHNVKGLETCIKDRDTWHRLAFSCLQDSDRK